MLSCLKILQWLPVGNFELYHYNEGNCYTHHHTDKHRSQEKLQFKKLLFDFFKTCNLKKLVKKSQYRLYCINNRLPLYDIPFKSLSSSS